MRRVFQHFVDNAAFLAIHQTILTAGAFVDHALMIQPQEMQDRGEVIQMADGILDGFVAEFIRRVVNVTAAETCRRCTFDE